MNAEMFESVKPNGTGRKRSKVCGFGITDAPFVTQLIIDGRRHFHPAYASWHQMIRRCYDAKYQAKRKMYVGASVCDEWSSFMSFKRWWDENSVHGWHLDKDILIAGNKVYSPSTCIFVPLWLNNFIVAADAIRGEFPIGVSFDNERDCYKAQCCDPMARRSAFIGRFSDPLRAHMAWYSTKIKYAGDIRSNLDLIDDRLYCAVIAKIDSMREW